MTLTAKKQAGKVYLVGSGPGDPELLTVKAVRLLAAADIVLHDDLVTPAVLARADRECWQTLWHEEDHAGGNQSAHDRESVARGVGSASQKRRSAGLWPRG